MKSKKERGRKKETKNNEQAKKVRMGGNEKIVI
jgi:hypothetical protein